MTYFYANSRITDRYDGGHTALHYLHDKLVAIQRVIDDSKIMSVNS